jgi:hypothetical protein
MLAPPDTVACAVEVGCTWNQHMQDRLGAHRLFIPTRCHQQGPSGLGSELQSVCTGGSFTLPAETRKQHKAAAVTQEPSQCSPPESSSALTFAHWPQAAKLINCRPQATTEHKCSAPKLQAGKYQPLDPNYSLMTHAAEFNTFLPQQQPTRHSGIG